MKVDVAIIGGGPAGLATAIGAATRGLSVAVFDKQRFPIDKACGEGLMPSGLAALERLGALKFLDRAESAPFRSITYVQESGVRAVGVLPAPGGLGVRRLALSQALVERAREAGVVLRPGCGVRAHRHVEGGVELETDSERVLAAVLVGADGLNSLTRQREGLQPGGARGKEGLQPGGARGKEGLQPGGARGKEGLAGPVARERRFGVRRHVKLRPWADTVEVHFAEGVEAYVTPAGVERVGVAFLWDASSAVAEDASFEALLERFPALAERVRGAEFDSTSRGAGPLLQHVTRRVSSRFALVGDAAGYVDAITGEGLTQAFEAAEALAAVLPAVIASGGAVSAFAPYERAAEAAFTRYARLANSLLWLARRPTLRRVTVATLARSPELFRRVLSYVL